MQCDAVWLRNVRPEQTFCDRLIHEGCGRGPHAGIGARHLKEALQLTVFALVAVKRQQGDIERDRLRPAEQVPLARHQQTFTVACRVQVTCVRPRRISSFGM